MRLARTVRITRWLHVTAEPVVREVRTKPPTASRLWLAALLALLAISLGADAVARAFLPLLLRSHPALLIALDAKAHILLLAGLKVSVVVFIVAAVVRRLATHVVYYLLGRWYGDLVLLWLGKRSTLAGVVADKVEAIFRRFSNLAVLLLSDDVVCLLAGTVGMSPARFLILQLLGTVLHIVALRVVIHLAHHQLTSVVSFIDGDATSLTLVFAIATVISIVLAMRIHRSSIRSAAAFLHDYDDEHRPPSVGDSTSHKNRGEDSL